MAAGNPYPRAVRLARRLARIRAARRAKLVKHRRLSVSKRLRAEVLAKTGGYCHICGGKIKQNHKWGANHVRPHSHGGSGTADNYLPAHGICNRSRWHYGAEEMRWILALGAWFRTQIERQDPAALRLANRFVSGRVERSVHLRVKRR